MKSTLDIQTRKGFVTNEIHTIYTCLHRLLQGALQGLTRSLTGLTSSKLLVTTRKLLETDLSAFEGIGACYSWQCKTSPHTTKRYQDTSEGPVVHPDA